MWIEAAGPAASLRGALPQAQAQEKAAQRRAVRSPPPLSRCFRRRAPRFPAGLSLK